jgi:hypothetical protein
MVSSFGLPHSPAAAPPAAAPVLDGTGTQVLDLSSTSTSNEAFFFLGQGAASGGGPVNFQHRWNPQPQIHIKWNAYSHIR